MCLYRAALLYSYLHAPKDLIPASLKYVTHRASCSFCEAPEIDKNILFRDGPLFFIRGGLPFLGLADNFFLRVMHFIQFFSLHFVMETIFLQPFFKNVTGFFIDLI